MTLNVIVPRGPSVANLNDLVVRSRKARVLKTARTFWNRVKISRLGQYSAARTEQLDDYCQCTSPLRVLLVCALVPWPALILELLIEIIPLSDPKLGWKVNYGAWIRLWIALASGSAGSFYQVRSAIPQVFSWIIVVVTLGTASIVTGLMILISSQWAFPVPFAVFAAGTLAAIVFVSLLLVIIKYARPTNNQLTGMTIDKTFKQKLYLVGVQVVLVAAYIAFSAMFTNCHSAIMRFGLLLFLPIMKHALKHLVAWIASDDTESIPTVVAFSVDVLNGLYSAICIQSSGSWWTALAMIALNVFHTALALREVERSAASFQKLNCLNRRVRGRSPSLLLSARWPKPIDGNIDPFKPTPSHQSRKVSSTKSSALTTRILFLLEYRALVGYIKATIPMLYAVYLSILVNLPSARYYPHTESLAPGQIRTIIGSIAAYTSTEIFSLVWLHMTLKRKFDFSLLYQLAFVLESATEALQGRLFVWIVLLLQLTLAHFGMDFTFEFEWIK